MNGEDL